VVVAVSALAATVAYPRLASLPAGYRLEGAARNLALSLQKIRLRAIGEGVCLQVTFDTVANTYRVMRGTGGGSGCTGVTYPTSDGPAEQIDDAGAIVLSATANPVFDTRGVAPTASVVTLTARTGAVRLVGLNAAGRVSIQ
jgi:Tfp pilus assembly protein FimT